ncbi:Probable enoyl-CoA hydratase echA8 [Leminorella richardii]|uniref:Probable enoyl-CoA hydratase echA8 n=1 Tax=Leminorella richardii TaxID=158841 RepID=A0A2X4ULK7_9GAMM|nr:enoyl-CoA hydratase-related protein [Leminorella richardii]SQI33820.1 Probable enoyl-CoA hydratase echA8 [Leminorella richardii]
MSNGSIDLSRDGFIATLTINRPEKMNALTPEMLEQLKAHCLQLETDRDVRVVLLTSACPKAFCVGADIHRWTSLTALDMWRSWIRRGHQAFDALAQLPQPVIALLHGLAYGGGLELAAAADIRLASSDARMAMPETGLATVPGWSGTQRLTSLLGRSLVKEMVFTGDPLSAERALSCGLVSQVVPAEQLSDAGAALAQRIAARAPIAVQIAKQVIDASDGIAAGLTLEALAGALSASTEDAKEGSQAFREKRTPQFRAR